MKKKKISLAVHPLFWTCGVYFCITGRLFAFLLATFAALEHELAHAFAAARRGYALDTIVLMPYGAIVRGDIGGISLADELAVALAGPLMSGATACAFVALWWFFPETYAYTDTACYACAALFFVNLLPAPPLDGGRVLFCLLARFAGRKKARTVGRALCVLCCLLLVGAFVYTCFHTVNISILFFALFLAVGAGQGEKYGYGRIRYDFSADLTRGLEERRVAVSKAFCVRRIFPLLSSRRYLLLDVYDEKGAYLATLRQEELLCRMERASLDETVGSWLNGEGDGCKKKAAQGRAAEPSEITGSAGFR